MAMIRNLNKMSRNMAGKNPSAEDNFWKSFVAGTQERFGDIFISYLITFEILYNWKFLYTLIIKDPEKSEKIIAIAIKYSGASPNQEFRSSLSNLVLSIASALAMCIAYPFISHGIRYLRKKISYWSNRILLEDYPTREEYLDLISRSNKISGELEDVKKNRQSEIDRIVEVFLNNELTPNKDKIPYRVMRASNNVVFENDQIVKKTLNGNMIEKLDPKSTSKENLFIIIEKIDYNLYLVAPIVPNVPITKKMKDSGKPILVIDSSGNPSYVDDKQHLAMRKNSDFFLMAQINNQEIFTNTSWP